MCYPCFHLHPYWPHYSYLKLEKSQNHQNIQCDSGIKNNQIEYTIYQQLQNLSHVIYIQTNNV